MSIASLPFRARLAVAAAAFALYAVLLFGPRVTLWHDAILLPVVVYLGASVVRSSRDRVPILTVVAVLVLSLELFYVWRIGWGGRNHVFAGSFALSDAGGYYADAERVLHGARMNGGGVRRPIFSAVLGGVLRLAGQDIRAAHVVTMLFWAGAGAFAAGEVWRTHGSKVGTIAFVVWVLFARRYIGFVQSEGIGGPVGALAFGLLWRASSMNARWTSTYLGGLLLQTVALLGRPGPLFVIVGVVVWAVLRAEKGSRLRMLALSAGVAAVGLAFQHVIRLTMTTSASYSDLPPILYGLVHGEDSNYVFSQHPWLGGLPESARAGAILPILGRDLLAEPWRVVVAPLRCLASWFYLPQGFFGFVWLNPDDRVLEDGLAVKTALREHGYAGPLLLWVRELGVYSLVNAVVMALAALAFVAQLLRSCARGWRSRAADARPGFIPVLAGIVASLPFLPPWITEGAQIMASIFFFVVVFALTSYLPVAERSADPESTEADPMPRAGPLVFGAVALLVAIVKLSPARPTEPPCGADGRYLADVDRRASVTYGPGAGPPSEADARSNVRMLVKHNAGLAEAIRRTLDGPHRMFPAYDACHDRPLYVVEPLALAPGGEASRPDRRWTWLTTEPLETSAELQSQLDGLDPKAVRRTRTAE